MSLDLSSKIKLNKFKFQKLNSNSFIFLKLKIYLILFFKNETLSSSNLQVSSNLSLKF